MNILIVDDNNDKIAKIVSVIKKVSQSFNIDTVIDSFGAQIKLQQILFEGDMKRVTFRGKTDVNVSCEVVLYGTQDKWGVSLYEYDVSWFSSEKEGLYPLGKVYQRLQKKK